MLMAGLMATGCHKEAKRPPATLNEAEKKFADICRNEHKLNVQVFDAKNTVWIYLPMEEDLIDYHGMPRTNETKSKKQFILSTFEGDFKDEQYRFLLDLTDGVKTSKDQGYKSDATEAFVKNRLLLYGAIGEVFFDLEKDKAPEFIAVVIANIKKGVAYKSIFHLGDYKLYRSDALTSEEYNLREASELYGDDQLVNDTEGKSLNIKPIEWSWFFIEQVKNRVNFKFLRSDFPPRDDVVIAIASTIADTFRYYEYGDYSAVLIKDLRNRTSYRFDKPQLMTFEETAGKTHPPLKLQQYLTPPQPVAATP